jgi:hypothetical protein
VQHAADAESARWAGWQVRTTDYALDPGMDLLLGTTDDPVATFTIPNAVACALETLGLPINCRISCLGGTKARKVFHSPVFYRYRTGTVNRALPFPPPAK